MTKNLPEQQMLSFTAGLTSVRLILLELGVPAGSAADGAVWVNPRQTSGLSEPEIHELAGSIRDHGLELPLIVRRVFFGEHDHQVHFIVEDGQRRTVALRYLVSIGAITDEYEVPVIIKDGGPVVMSKAVAAEMMETALEVGLKRVGLSTYELIGAAVALASNDRKQNQIAKRISRSEAWVSKMLTAWKAAEPDLRESLRTGAVTDEQFQNLAMVAKTEQAAAVAEVKTIRQSGERSAARATAAALAAPVKDAKSAASPRAKAGPVEVPAAPAPARPGMPAPKGKAATSAPAKPARTVRTAAQIGELYDLAKIGGDIVKRYPANQAAYVRGALDMILWAGGEDPKLHAAFNRWVGDVTKKMSKGQRDAFLKLPPPAPKKAKRDPAAICHAKNGTKDPTTGCIHAAGHSGVHSNTRTTWSDRKPKTAKTAAEKFNAKPAAVKAKATGNPLSSPATTPAPGDIVRIQWDPRSTKLARFVRFAANGSIVVQVERVNGKGESTGGYGSDRNFAADQLLGIVPSGSPSARETKPAQLEIAGAAPTISKGCKARHHDRCDLGKACTCGCHGRR